MSTRNIKKKKDSSQNHWGYSQFEFPKDGDGIIYVRQSSIIQVKNNIHSFEMQTDKFVEHFRNAGCTGNITIIADDEAMSGTLDIHNRLGLSRAMRLIEGKELIDGKRIKWVGAVHVNRLTRDPWLITPAVLMKACHDNDVWVATLRMHFNFKDPYCQRVFMLEAEESARHLEWMKLVLGGGKKVASGNGYYDGRGLNIGYIIDRTDQKRKKYIIYEPHAQAVRWLFRRFLELDGNFPALCREVEKMPYLFFDFEPGIDTRGFKRKPKRLAGHWRKPTENGLKGILTNPAYIGWWIPLEGGVIENNHEPIVEEALFVYAHKRLSVYDLKGERQKPLTISRSGRAKGILKKVLKAPDGNPIYATYEAKILRYRYTEYTGMSHEYRFSVPIKVIDPAFTTKFLEHLHNDFEKVYNWEEQREKKQVAKGERDKLIKKSIKEAELKMQRINDLVTDIENPLPTSMVRDLGEQYKGLAEKKERLEDELKSNQDEEGDEEILYEISTLVPDIIAEWNNLSFEKKLRLVGALVRQVTLDIVTPGWVKMEIEWKFPAWDVDMAYIRRDPEGGAWTDEDDAIIHELYPTADIADIVKALPNRTWRAIRSRAFRIPNVSRMRRGGYNRGGNSVKAATFLNLSWRDLEYAEENNLDANDKNPQWSM